VHKRSAAPFQGVAGLSLLVAMFGGLVVLAGTLISSTPPLLLLAGLAGVVAGVAGLSVLAYRDSRRADVNVLRSLSRTTREAAKLLWYLLA
jgi:hypothetical protein